MLRIDLPRSPLSTTFLVPPPPLAQPSSPLHDWSHVKSEHVPEVLHNTHLGVGLSCFMTKTPKVEWWTTVEEKEPHAAVGDRFLVYRDEHVRFGDRVVVQEYVSTRVATPAKWSRQSVAYYKDTPSPYPFHHNRTPSS